MRAGESGFLPSIPCGLKPTDDAVSLDVAGVLVSGEPEGPTWVFAQGRERSGTGVALMLSVS
jgi:hypothetical protein